MTDPRPPHPGPRVWLLHSLATLAALAAMAGVAALFLGALFTGQLKDGPLLGTLIAALATGALVWSQIVARGFRRPSWRLFLAALTALGVGALIVIVGVVALGLDPIKGTSLTLAALYLGGGVALGGMA